MKRMKNSQINIKKCILFKSNDDDTAAHVAAVAIKEKELSETLTLKMMSKMTIKIHLLGRSNFKTARESTMVS